MSIVPWKLRGGAVGGSATRVQNTTNQTTVKNASGLLWRLIVSNADAAVQTVTVVDGSTTLNVIRVAAGATLPVELRLPFAASLKLTPSHANIDCLAIYD